MFQRKSSHVHYWITFILLCMPCSLTQADWQETFDNGSFDLSTWQFLSYPALTGTFTGTIQAGADGNDFLAIAETSPPDVGGAQFGIALGSTEEFTDVRVGCVVNAGSLDHNYMGLAARTTYLMDDESITGYPGVIASTYLMMIQYQEGPANLRIEVFKIANLSENIMKTYHEVVVPDVGNARSYYVELDVVGSDPVYVTGSLYAHKGGPLLARTPTMIDTNGADHWEHPGFHDAVYAGGVSAVFSMEKDSIMPGFTATFDDVSSATISEAESHVKDVAVDDFEAYEENSDIAAAWVCNISGYDYVQLNKDKNDERLQLQYSNQYEPYYTEAVRTFDTAQDWTVGGLGILSLSYQGDKNNVRQSMSIILEDAAGGMVTIMHPYPYAVQSKFWREWEIDLREVQGIDFTAIKKLTLRVGDGEKSDQSETDEDRDEMLVNDIRFNPAQ